MDVTIVADNASLNEAAERKETYYDRKQIIALVKNLTSCENVSCHGIVFNLRGAMTPSSYHLLSVTLCRNVSKLIFLKTVLGSYHCYCCFQRSTYRVGSL